MDADSIARQARKDREYAAELERLHASGELSPGVLGVLTGGDQAPSAGLKDYVGNAQEHDISELSIGTTFDLTTAVERLEDVLKEAHARGCWPAVVAMVRLMVQQAERTTQAAVIPRIVGPLYDAANIRLELVALAFAANIACTLIDRKSGKLLTTQTQYAASIGVTRAAVSKSANRWTAVLGLAPAPGMRQAGAVAANQKATTAAHARKRQQRESRPSKDQLLARFAQLN